MSSFCFIFFLRRRARFFSNTKASRKKNYLKRIMYVKRKEGIFNIQHVAVHFYFYSKNYSPQNAGESTDMLTLYSRLYTGSALLHHYNLQLKFVYRIFKHKQVCIRPPFQKRHHSSTDGRRLPHVFERVFVQTNTCSCFAEGIRPCTNTYPCF